MTAFLWTASTGWLAVLAFGATALLPFLLARRTTQALRPHVWSGFAVVAVALAHAMTPGQAMRGADPLGLMLATIAVFGLMWQVVIGSALRLSTGADRRRDRRLHVWGVPVLSLVLAGHIVLNRVV